MGLPISVSIQVIEATKGLEKLSCTPLNWSREMRSSHPSYPSTPWRLPSAYCTSFYVSQVQWSPHSYLTSGRLHLFPARRRSTHSSCLCLSFPCVLQRRLIFREFVPSAGFISNIAEAEAYHRHDDIGRLKCLERDLGLKRKQASQ